MKKLLLALMLASVAAGPYSAPGQGGRLRQRQRDSDGPRDGPRQSDRRRQRRKIASIGPAAKAQVPAGATKVDAKGKYLMPALAEMHAHVPGGQAPDAVVERVIFLYAANGIGTIRSMLGHPRSRPAARAPREGRAVRTADVDVRPVVQRQQRDEPPSRDADGQGSEGGGLRLPEDPSRRVARVLRRDGRDGRQPRHHVFRPRAARRRPAPRARGEVRDDRSPRWIRRGAGACRISGVADLRAESDLRGGRVEDSRIWWRRRKRLASARSRPKSCSRTGSVRSRPNRWRRGRR